MLSASVIGPATSIGGISYTHESSQNGSSSKFHRHLQSVPSDDVNGSRTGHAFDGEEELAWWGRRVIWSRGGEMYRQWSFEGDTEGDEVAWAGFVWFPRPGSLGTGTTLSNGPSTSPRTSNTTHDATFGPFHSSQDSSWGMPSASSSNSTEKPHVRTVLILLNAQGLVYYPSGEVTSFHLPVPVSWAFSLPRAQGGVLLQRKLKLKEQNIGNGEILNGLKSRRRRRSSGVGMTSVLDDIRDLDRGADLPRLYTLSDPFDELKMAVEARIRNDRLVSPEEPIDSSMSVLFSASDPHSYPFVILLDRSTSDVIFYQRTNIPLKTAPPPATTPRTMRPEDVLKQGTPSIGLGTSRIRPSMHRTTSGYSATGERQASAGSGMMVDPMDRARRTSRLSKAGSGALDGLPSTSTGDLQAALDPPMLPTQTSNITTRSKGKKRARESQGAPSQISSGAGLGGLDEGRRQSGASSFMREDPDAGKGEAGVALHGIGDRDLRETTMMMGVERDEEALRSEIVLERIWSWKPPEHIDPERTRVFISDNLTERSTNLNIVTPSTLYIFRADKPASSSRWTIYPLKSMSCSSAIPLMSTRPAVLDTILLQDGELRVVTSEGREIPLKLPATGVDKELPTKLASSLSMRFDEDLSMTSVVQGSSPRYLEAEVGGRFTVVFQDGDRIRMSADFTLRDELARQCLEALAWVLDGPHLFALKRDVLLGIQELATAQRSDPGAVWRVFERCVLGLVGRHPHLSKLSKRDKMVKASTASQDPVTRRLAAKLASNVPEAKQDTAQSDLGAEEISRILLALHLVAQDCRLRSADRCAFERVGSLVLSLAAILNQSLWWDYWKRILPVDCVGPSGDEMSSDVLETYETPPDIFVYLSRRLLTPLKPFPSPRTIAITNVAEFGDADPCPLTSLVISIYDLLGHSPLDSRVRNDSIVARAAVSVKFMVDHHLDIEWLLGLSCAISLPIMELIRVCQAAPDKNWSEAMFTFIGRADLAARVASDWSANQPALEPTPEVVPSIADINKSLAESLKTRGQKPTLPYVRFGSDRRLQEVERIMQTTKIRTIAVQEPKNASDQELVRYQQEVVNTISNRTLAIPVGQGMFEYGTRTATITEIWDIPVIELSIKILPAKTTLRAQINAENADWPCFHNGVSAALSISPDCKGIESSWIVFNRPLNLNPEHGGFLLGLGLTGHLKSLMTYHAFPYLEPRHDFTSVGLLLGLSASYAGSEDLLLTKVLSLHTHALLPLGSMDLNASTIIQASALVGLGLVYAGRKNLRMAEVALAEVGRKQLPGVEGFGDYQEAYSFSASMAFGLIMLGRGGHVTSEVDRRMLSQLQRCIIGDAPTLDGRRGGMDTTLTAPGATLALGLMYLKTGRKDVTDSLEIPQSAFALEHVRPDTLLLRTFARALIMWDDILPSMAWIESQIPTFIKHKEHKKSSQLELNTELAYLNIVAGACLAIGLKYAGTATELAHTNLMFFFSVLSKAASGQSMTYEGNIRRTTARQGLNVVTIALAVVMSGTGELNVLRRLRISHGQEGAGVTYGTHMAMHMACGILFLGRGHYTLGNSNLAIAAMAIAFFPRFSPSAGDNTAYPQAFRHLWALAVEPRCLIAKDVNTRETVYLPVKIKLNEGAQTRTQSLISPTLIAPLDTIRSIEVDSPRYWPISYDLDTNRDNLIKTRTIKVKRKAGFLDYNSDPKGNRSIFVKAGSMTGFDLHYDLVSPSAPPMISADEVTTLMAAHSGDPVLVYMAKHFSGDSSFDKFVRTILLECVSLDKPTVLTVYLELLLSTRDNSPEVMSQHAMVKAFYAVYDKYYALSSATERKFALVRPSFVSTIERQLAVVESDGSTAYLANGDWSDGSLARWISTHHVPSWALLEVLRDKVKGRGEDAELRVRAVADAYAASAASQWDAVDGVREEGPRWSLASVQQAISIWTNT